MSQLELQISVLRDFPSRLLPLPLLRLLLFEGNSSVSVSVKMPQGEEDDEEEGAKEDFPYLRHEDST